MHKQYNVYEKNKFLGRFQVGVQYFYDPLAYIVIKIGKERTEIGYCRGIEAPDATILLGIFFVFVGTMKLTSHISKDLHKDLRKEYVKYAKVFPLSGTLDFKVPSKWYRRVVGSLEIICGLAMAIVPS
ncbi:hypothetical protein E2986_13601, partial [Frieseomelitta varia]